MVHFLGSDNHRVSSVYSNIDSSIEQLEKLIGAKKVQDLTYTNPKAILDNETIDIPEPKEIKKGLFGFKK